MPVIIQRVKEIGVYLSKQANAQGSFYENTYGEFFPQTVHCVK